MVAKYSEWTRGQDEALLNKLGGMEIARKLLDCRKVTVQFNTTKKQAAITATADLENLGIGPLNCSRPFDPTAFINKGWTVAEQDERALSLTEIDVSKVSFETCLKSGEARIEGEEKLKRFKARPDLVPLGATQCQALLDDYKTKGTESILEWLRKEQGITYLDFFATILRNPDGRRYVLYLCWHDGEWFWYYLWLGRGWGAGGHSAALASSELGT